MPVLQKSEVLPTKPPRKPLWYQAEIHFPSEERHFPKPILKSIMLGEAESSGLENPRSFFSPACLPLFQFVGVSTQQSIWPEDADAHKTPATGHADQHGQRTVPLLTPTKPSAVLT